MDLQQQLTRVRALQKEGLAIIKQFEQLAAKPLPRAHNKAIARVQVLFRLFIRLVAIRARVRACVHPRPRVKQKTHLGGWGVL